MQTTNFVHLLSDFVAQRPGFDLCNYSTIKDYRADYYQAFKFKKAYERLLIQTERIFSFEDINKALGQRLKNNPGRLSYDVDRAELEYITGQYFPVEYRPAAFSVLFYSALDVLFELFENRPELKDQITVSDFRKYLHSTNRSFYI
jgi:hypothetical protein